MKTTITKISTVIMFTVIMMWTAKTNAATYTAVASGAWSSAATWGGSAPSNNVNGDDIVIASGLVVTLESDVTISGTFSSLDVDGKLTSGTNTSAVIMNGGALTGAGIIEVTSLSMNATSTLTFTGQVIVDNFTAGMGTFLTTANYTVKKKAVFITGIMRINTGGNFEVGNDATIEIAGGGITSTGGNIVLAGAYNLSYTSTSPSTTGAEIHGAMLKNLTVNTGGGNSIMLDGDVTVNGTLDLSSGELDLNGHHLTVKGDMAAAGTGTLAGNSTSDLTVQTAASLTGMLRFSSGKNTLRNMTVNMGQATGEVKLTADLVVHGAISLTNGRINTGDFVLENSGSITSANSNSYVITGTNGALLASLTAGGSAYTYHVGSADYYAPATIRLISGSASRVKVNVKSKVLTQGTTGNDMSTTRGVVDATWDISSNVTSNINMEVEAWWSTAMEKGGFNRNNAYLSHYTSGNWDVAASATVTAQANGMYSLKRSNITSLSPFAVVANNPTGIAAAAGSEAFEVYPNPATDRLSFSNISGTVKVEVLDQLGKLVKSEELNATQTLAIGDLQRGSYFIKVSGNENTVTRKFIKL